MPNWADVLRETQESQRSHINSANLAVDTIRHKYLNSLFTYTDRNIIAYYSGFLSKPGVYQSDINDEDKNGFMMAVHKLDRKKGLDLFLHTPGGDIAATQSIVDYLQKMFGNNIRAIIPQIAMSAGTMMACTCKEILMSNHSNIGPIDPHLNGVPAFGVIEEFRRACKEVKNDAATIPIWQSIISQYRPTFLSRCENAIKWSNTFVQEHLETVMFKDDPNAKTKAIKIVKKLTNYSKNRTHNRHIHFEECKKMGLKVTKIEDDNTLQDLVLTVHHCYMHAMMNTSSYKMIENHLGVALVKQEVIQRQ
jgi:hypothetical protein